MIRTFWISILATALLIPSILFGKEEEIPDPFEPRPVIEQIQVSSQVPTPAQVEAKLEGITIGPKGALAVINGEVYHEGKQRGAIKVTQIRKKEVDILINGVSSTLKMTPQMVQMLSKDEEEKK